MTRRRTGLLPVLGTLLLLAVPAAEASGEALATATRLAESGHLDQALDAFEAALEKAPNDLHLGAEYRQVVIEAEAYDRCLAFFEKLVTEHPGNPNALLNRAFAYVDKVPVEGAITAVILANKALGIFGEAIELEESWLALYSRGNSYMYWPAIFGRTPKGIADLEKAIAMSREGKLQPFHARAWAALGDGYWRLDEREKMREAWAKGLELFPDDPYLKQRLSLEGDALDDYLNAQFETSHRVDTHLREMLPAEESR